MQVFDQQGSDVIRTYIKVDDLDPLNLKPIIEDIKQIIAVLKKHRIELCLANHEHETSDHIIEIIKAVDSVWFGAHCDISNSMMAWEDPVACGVPIGEGSIDIDECFVQLVERSSVTKINIEICYPYCAPFTREKGAGGISELRGHLR